MKSKQTIEAELVASLYVINKQTKKYRDKASKAYRRNKGATARKNKCRKEALYEIKDRVLKKIHTKAHRVEIHEINGDDFYCLYFVDNDDQQWSFHSPVEQLNIADDRVSDRSKLEDFSGDSEKEATNRSLKASLLYIEDEFGLNANHYLEDKYVDYGSSTYFAGWKYLGN